MNLLVYKKLLVLYINGECVKFCEYSSAVNNRKSSNMSTMDRKSPAFLQGSRI